MASYEKRRVQDTIIVISDDDDSEVFLTPINGTEIDYFIRPADDHVWKRVGNDVDGYEYTDLGALGGGGGGGGDVNIANIGYTGEDIYKGLNVATDTHEFKRIQAAFPNMQVSTYNDTILLAFSGSFSAPVQPSNFFSWTTNVDLEIVEVLQFPSPFVTSYVNKYQFKFRGAIKITPPVFVTATIPANTVLFKILNLNLYNSSGKAKYSIVKSRIGFEDSAIAVTFVNNGSDLDCVLVDAVDVLDNPDYTYFYFDNVMLTIG